MGVTLALLSALCFGLSDFIAGLLARRIDGAAVAFVGQICGTALVVVTACCVTAPDVSTGALMTWGALSGTGTGLGAAFLFRAMAAGRFSIVVPLSDLAGVALPW
jgi:uncharacterized membrane protein